jgi:hypothetical protein
MRVHERDQAVQVASARMGIALLDVAKEHDLTDIEYAVAASSALSDLIGRHWKYELRWERHGNTEDPAGIVKAEFDTDEARNTLSTLNGLWQSDDAPDDDELTPQLQEAGDVLSAAISEVEYLRHQLADPQEIVRGASETVKIAPSVLDGEWDKERVISFLSHLHLLGANVEVES